MSSIREHIIKIHPLIEGLIRILECPESYAVLPDVQGDSLQKSAERASKLLAVGRQHFKLRQYDEASIFFNEGIATAPPNSASLGIAYNRRSALSRNLECFENCLLNVNRALSQPVPETVGQNLVKRKLKCWEALRSKHDPAAGSKEVGNSMYAALPCPKSSICRQMRLDLADITPENLPPHGTLWDTEFNNPLLPNVSSKVKIEQNLEYGRHLIATEDIEPGEILWIQDSYSMMNMRSANDDQHCYCAYCTSFCEALIPCLTCTQEMYCSLYCRESAYNAYHRTECKLLTFLPKPLRGSTRVRLSLQIFLTGTKQGADLKKLMNDSKVFEILEEGSNCVGVPYVTNDYLAILNLRWRDVGLYADSSATDEDRRMDASRPVVQNETIPDNDGSTEGRNDYGEFENNSACLILRSTFLAIFSALKRISFFDDKIHTFQVPSRSTVDDRLTDTELFACVLLLQNLLVLKQNYGFLHSYSAELQTLTEPDTGCIQLGSIADLMNHSCDPNTATVKHRRKILTYSLRPIKAGEQLFTHYECSFCSNTLRERQEYLKSHYNMECRCPACTHNWPLWESPHNAADLEFSKLNKSDSREIQEVYEWWKNSGHKISFGAKVDLKEAFQCRKIIHEHIVHPSIIATFCERYILQAMKTMSEDILHPSHLICGLWY